MSRARILIVDDEPEKLGTLRSTLELNGCEVQAAGNGRIAVELLADGPPPDLVLMDYIMPEMNGLQAIERLRGMHPGLRIVMLSSLGDTRTAVAAARLGAMDYLTKPLNQEDVRTILGFIELAHQAPEDGPPAPGTIPIGDNRFCVIAGTAMQRIYNQVAQVAPMDVPVLILGESGTGKEVIARLLQRHSARADKPFVKLNCAALPADLLESELFGYEAGAFTGANKNKQGMFSAAEQGTIFLDEIGEMPPLLQAKMLHVLQDGSYTKLGSTRALKADVRVISATNIKIQEAIQEQKFREDLYYRLNTFTIRIPPLRERKEEIPVLLRHLMARFAQEYGRAPLPFSSSMLERCLIHPWPGNLRELENFVKRYLILGDEDLALEDLSQSIGSVPVAPSAPARELPATPELSAAPANASDLKSMVRTLKGEAEAVAILQALQEARGVRKDAAQLLNISYKSLLQKIRRYGLEDRIGSRR